MKSVSSLVAFAAVVLLSACGGPPTIQSFTADKQTVDLGESVTLSWTVDGADTLTLNGDTVTGTSTTVTPGQTTTYTLAAKNGHGSASSAGVEVTVNVQNVQSAPWAIYGAQNYSGDSLTVDVDSLGPDEHLAIIPINLSAVDVSPTAPVANATLTVTGTGPTFSRAPAGSAPPALASLATSAPGDLDALLARKAMALRGHDLVRNREADVLRNAARLQKSGLLAPAPSPSVKPQLSPAAAPATSSFCVAQGVSPSAPHVLKTATLLTESNHAIFYVDDDDLSDYQAHETIDGDPADIRTKLRTVWDDTIYPRDTQTFGAESDVDQNGKLIVFFSHELGAPSGGGVVMGYYWAGDVIYSLHGVDCNHDANGVATDTGNRADMFYMNTFTNLQQAGYVDSNVIDESYPDTLGHEFQHLINFNQKHIIPDDYNDAEDTWINEGLSVTAEDIVGFGWNTAFGRASGNALLTDQPYGQTNYLRYFNTSLSNWEGDPIGDYEGAHAFFRYFVDQRGPAILKNIVQTAAVGSSNVARVLNEPFDQAFGEYTTALLFSNESNAPGANFDFTGANWDPLHQKLTAQSSCSSDFPYPNRPGYVEYKTMSNGTASAALRAIGWNAFITNAGTGGPVSINLQSKVTGFQPNVVVIKFSGDLPDGRQLAACQ